MAEVIGPLTTQLATIAAGESLSTVIDASAASPIRVIMPAAWTGTYLTFQISNDGVNFYELYGSDGHPVVVTIVPGTAVAVTSTNLGFRTGDYFRIRAGSAQQPRPQDAQRTFIVVLGS